MDMFLSDGRWAGISAIFTVMALIVTIIADREKLTPLYPIFMIIILIFSIIFSLSIIVGISFINFTVNADRMLNYNIISFIISVVLSGSVTYLLYRIINKLHKREDVKELLDVILALHLISLFVLSISFNFR